MLRLAHASLAALLVALPSRGGAEGIPPDTTGEFEETLVEPPEAVVVPEAAPPAAPQAAPMTDIQQRRRDRAIRRADIRFNVFAALAYTGLALSVASPFIYDDVPIEVAQGLFYMPALYSASVPLMGAAANSLNRQASAVPGHVDPGSGWAPYGWGQGLKGVGAAWFLYVFLSNMELSFLFGFPLPYADLAWTDVAAPIAVIGSGFLAEGYAMYRFHVRRDAAMESLQARLSLAPVIRRTSAGNLALGAAFSLAY